MAGALLRRLDNEVPTLIFTNTRRQAELWYQHLRAQRPQLAERIALHHGSLDQATRARIEAGAKAGSIRWTVATASLDLGIDYPGIDVVVQIGSPKSIARLLQRAGRSGHRPGASSRIIFVPTHAMELVEFMALHQALQQGDLETIHPLPQPLDVLAQHLVTLACGEGFAEEELYNELRLTQAYHQLSRADFARVMQMISQGGACLSRYDHYRKITQAEDNTWHIANRRFATAHRLQIGTIVADPQITVAWKNRRRLGTVEESFITRLRSGDTFYFAGHHLRFDRLREHTAFVSKAAGGNSITPAWAGGNLPLSPTLTHHLRAVIAQTRRDMTALDAISPAIDATTLSLVRQVLTAQQSHSRLPAADELLIELLDHGRYAQVHQSHEKLRSCFIHAFAGRHVHEGLGALLALRLGRLQPISCEVRLNDYGVVIEAPSDYPFAELLKAELLTTARLEEDLDQALNMDALTRRAFREVGHIAGLLGDGLPGDQRSRRQVQASAELLFEVFQQHEPDHVLLQEARREVLHHSLDATQLRLTLERLSSATLNVVQLNQPSPLAFPLLIENLHHSVSNEPIEDRIARLQAAYGIQ